MIINAFALAALLSLSAAAAPAAPSPFLEALAARPGIENASWGVSVKDAATGASVAELHPRLNLVPASILKIFVTAAALDKFGPDKTFRTGLYYDGEISGGVLSGNLYIRGGGDPSLGSRFIKDAPALEEVYAAWTRAVSEAGISSVSGAVVGDDSAFKSVQPGSWAWEDIGNYYAAQPSALTANDGLYKLFLRPSAAVGGAAEVLRTEPYVEGLEFENYLKTGPAGSGDNGYIYAFPGQAKAVLRGTIPQGAPEFAIKGALPDPALFLARGFSEALGRARVAAGGKAYKGAPPAGRKLTLIAETVSRPLKDIVRVTNKRSFNLYAELLLRHLGGGDPDAGLAAVKAYLAAGGAGTGELKLFDACGMSPRNLVQAENFTDLLVALRGRKYYREFYDSLVYPADPEATGHVRGLGKGTWLERNLRLKSGSIGGVRAYTGYLKTKKGRDLAFTSILNNYSVSPSEIDRLHAELLLELADKY